MTMRTPTLLLAVSLGAACAFALAAVGPGMVVEALADEFSGATNSIDPANLVRYEERDYVVDYDDWVATEPLSTTRIKKVEAGVVSYVTITTTATGTYSTDAMFSRHVQYPGIAVETADAHRNFFSYWTNGDWSAFSTGDAGSFVYFGYNP